ncbi:hypothetical protein [Bradyrhizobium sp. AZCC 2289]
MRALEQTRRLVETDKVFLIFGSCLFGNGHCRRKYRRT